MILKHQLVSTYTTHQQCKFAMLPTDGTPQVAEVVLPHSLLQRGAAAVEVTEAPPAVRRPAELSEVRGHRRGAGRGRGRLRRRCPHGAAAENDCQKVQWLGITRHECYPHLHTRQSRSVCT